MDQFNKFDNYELFCCSDEDDSPGCNDTDDNDDFISAYDSGDDEAPSGYGDMYDSLDTDNVFGSDD